MNCHTEQGTDNEKTLPKFNTEAIVSSDLVFKRIGL